MLIELLSNSNNQTYNVWLAHKIGLNVAIYFSVLLDDYKLSLGEGTVDDNQFFTPNRDFITAKTTFTETEQLNFEDCLCKLGFITLSEDKLKCKLNLTLFIGMMNSENKDIDLFCSTVKATSLDKNEGILIGVKKKINKNYPGNVQNALSEWLNTINEKYGYVNKTMITQAQKQLDKIIYSDLNKALEIIEIATVQAYRDMSWAFIRYDDLHKNDKINTNVQIINNQNLSEEYF